MNANSTIRIVATALLLVAAYSLGRFYQSKSTIRDAQPPETAIQASDPVEKSPPEAPEAPQLSREEQLRLDISKVADAARSMSLPDARTYEFFENLDLDDLPAVVDFIEEMPAGNEQDFLYVMAMRQWARLDGPGALQRAATFPMLGTRSTALEAVYSVWAEHDSEAALLRAVDEPEPDQMIAGVAAVVAGAAAADPKDALTLWNIAPRGFLDSPASQRSLEQIVESAYGTGKKDAIRLLIEQLSAGDMRTLMANALVTNWARHYPDDAYAWLNEVLPPGEEQDTVAKNMFASMTLKDPEMAANWAARSLPVEKQAMFIPAAVAQWARIDLKGVEIWMNEQPGGNYLDGASFALAKHYLDAGQMKNSFAWIRRVNEDRNRAELLVRLGRRWSEEQPEEFKRFLEETSLSQVEVDILTSGIEPRS